MTSKKYIPKYHGGEMIGSFNVDDLRKKYDSLSARQLKRFPTFESYKAEVSKRDSNRLKSNKIGDEASKVALEQAQLNNEAYDEYIKENPEEEVRKIKGKLYTKGEYRKELEQKAEEKFKQEHPVHHAWNEKFFKPVVQGLTNVADTFVDVLPAPVSMLYQNFAPPTSKFYDDNVLKALGSGFNVKELKQHAKTLNIEGHEKMKKHELVHNLHGKGFFDWIPVVKDKIKHFVDKIPSPFKKAVSNALHKAKNIDSYNRKSKKTLEQYGNQEIKDIKIFRQHISGLLGKTISFITGYDGKLYHLGMICTLADGKEITVEKNHVVNVVEGSTIKPSDEVIEVNLQGKHLTLNELLDKAIETVGRNQIFEYSALQGKSCQNFIIDLMRSNGLLTKEIEDFTLQDLSQLETNSKFGKDTTQIIKGVTDVRNAIDNVTGFGLKKSRKSKK